MKQLLIKLTVLMTSMAIVAIPVVANAADVDKRDICGGANLSFSNEAKGCAKVQDQETGEFREARPGERPAPTINRLITNIVNIISIIVGIVAVIMIIFGGFKYITSGGDSGNVSGAKNTILYAIVGLIIVALAQVIVRFVLDKST